MVERLCTSQQLQNEVGNAKIVDNANDQRISESLEEVNEKNAMQRSKIEQIDEKFAKVKDNRKQAFLDCLKLTIANFCLSTLNGVETHLEATNEEELHGISYYWIMLDDPE